MQQFAGAEVGTDLLGVQLGRGLIRNQDHDHVGPLGGFGNGSNLEPGLLGLGDGLGVLGQADLHLHAGVLQVESMRMPLRSVADDGHLLGLDKSQVRIIVVISRRHFFLSFFEIDFVIRARWAGCLRASCVGFVARRLRVRPLRLRRRHPWRAIRC